VLRKITSNKNFKFYITNFFPNIIIKNTSRIFPSTNSYIPLSKSIRQNKLIISNYFSFSNKSMEKTNTIYENKDSILKLLKDSNIEVAHVEDHEELKTVNDALERLKSVTFGKEYVFPKNLFLKNKSGGFVLVTANSVNILFNQYLVHRIQFQELRKNNKNKERQFETSGTETIRRISSCETRISKPIGPTKFI
jgi:hypothetical protein